MAVVSTANNGCNRVLARYYGGPKSYTAIITAIHVKEVRENLQELKVRQRLKRQLQAQQEGIPLDELSNDDDSDLEEMAQVDRELQAEEERETAGKDEKGKMLSRVTYDLKYIDGAVERGAKRDWLKFVARPRFMREDEEPDLQFLAEEPPTGLAGIKSFLKHRNEAAMETGAAETTQAATGGGGKKKAYIADLKIIVGDEANLLFEQEQQQRLRLGKPFFTRIEPDLRAAQRLGSKDSDSVYLWGLWESGKGPFITDIRLVSPMRLDEQTAYWDSVREAGYNTLYRPNLPTAGADEQYCPRCML